MHFGVDKHTLVGKIMLAGMDDSHDFNEKKEACIRKHYDADEVELTSTKTVKKNAN